MVRSSKDIRGMAIVDLAAGKKLGHADEVVVSGEELRLLGFVMKSGGLFDKSERFVDSADVLSIGEDAITVDGDQVVRARESASEDFRDARSGNRPLIGNKVVTRSGSLIGTVTDYLIDETTKRVVAFTISSGVLSTGESVQADLVESVGPDVIVINDVSESVVA